MADKHPIDAVLEETLEKLNALLTDQEAAKKALRDVVQNSVDRVLGGGMSTGGKTKGGAGKTGRKNPGVAAAWAALSPKARAERIKRMTAWRRKGKAQKGGKGKGGKKAAPAAAGGGETGNG